jgi:hypothetical protein
MRDTDADDGDDDSTELKTIAPDNQQTITMSATVPAEDLAPPQRNYLAEKADQFERDFIETAASMRLDGNEQDDVE